MFAKGSLAIYNANIHTMDTRRPSADALVIYQGYIVAVGQWQRIRDTIPALLPHLDAGGATVLPGLIDSHAHLAHSGLIASSVDLTDIPSVVETLDRIQQAVSAARPGELIYCTQYDDGRVCEKRYPSLQELDLIAPVNPLVIVHRTGHSSVLNSMALQRAAIPPDTPGIQRDAAGSPSGVLLAQANAAWRDTFEEAFTRQIGYTELARRAARQAAEAGITTLHAMDDPPFIAETLPLLEELPVRVVFYPQTRSVETAEALGLPRIGGCGDSGLDGDIGSQMTAALTQPYLQDPTTSGCLYFSDEELTRIIFEAQSCDMQVSMHAVGDAAVAQALRAVEAVQQRLPHPPKRHRIEHWEVSNPPLTQKAHRLGVMVSIQPPFNHFWPHNDGYPELLGTERSLLMDPIAELIEGGLVVAGGSDSPVTPLSPLLGIHAAVNHSNPSQRISPRQALEMFTLNGAEIAFEEHLKGSLTLDKLGDVTILAEDPLSAPPGHIKDISVLCTIKGGEITYRHPDLPPPAPRRD